MSADLVYKIEYKRFLDKLRTARVESGFTQVEISKKIKKPQSYISKIETGERRIDISELIILSKIYKKPLDYFIK